MAGFSPCSSSCGLGVASQMIVCVQFSEGREAEVANTSCLKAEKPLSSISCIDRMCSYEWRFTKWTEVLFQFCWFSFLIVPIFAKQFFFLAKVSFTTCRFVKPLQGY